MEIMMSTASESINEIIEKLHYEVLLIHTKWEMYRQLFRHSEARLQLLSERTYAFFSLIQRVLMNDIRLSLSKLMIPHEQESMTTCRLLILDR
jgi:hypothetical protein